MLTRLIRSLRPIVRRRLVVIPLAVFFVVASTGATYPRNFPSDPIAPGLRASTVDADPPQITSLINLNLPNYEFQITGMVTDPANNVSGLTVTFAGDGLPNGQSSIDLSVTALPGMPANTTGTFAVVVQLQANTTNGPLTYEWTAVASDGQGRVSTEVSCEITLQPSR